MSASGTTTHGGGPLTIFISYRRQDAAPYAGRLYDDLTERFGEAQVFMDIEAIEVGADFEQVIVQRIAGADVLLAVVGPHWVTATDERGRRRLDEDDDFVRKELEVALNSEVRVIPILVQDASMPAAHDLPPSIASFIRRQAFVLSDRRWRAEVAELMAALAGLAPRNADTSPARDAPPATRAVTSLPTPRGRAPALPSHRTRFVGRGDDVKRVHELLESTGFVTIVGPGGVGKSRLAVEAARGVEARYADGVCLAELASLADPALVVATVARATGVDELARDATLDRVLERLAGSQLLLVLDNCEHLIDEAAAVAEALMRRCPALHLLTTSRETLDVDGEAVWRLAPLATPDPDRPATAIDLGDSPAAMLFADRAALASPSFRLDDGSAPAVAQLTAALDGLPLALELAAASLRHMDLDELVGGLTDRFATVAAQRRTSEARQRTLWDTVDWSYQLLDEADQVLLERLGVFSGPFTPASAELVCGSGGLASRVGAGVARLVERSLVDRVDGVGGTDGAGRFRLLYTVRDFARTRLASRADDPTPARLQGWAVDVARHEGRAVDVGDELAGLQRLDAEHPNLIAVLAAALDASESAVAGEIASSLAPYWEVRGLRADGLGWVERALALAPSDDAVLGRCLLAAGRLMPTAAFEGRRQRASEALAVADRAGDDALGSTALASLGHIDFETEHREAARVHLDAALARARAAGDDAAIALALLRLGVCAQGEGDGAALREPLAEATRLYEGLGNRRGQFWCAAELGFDFLTTSDLDDAAVAFERGLDQARQLGYLHGEGWMLDALGETAGAAGRFAESRGYFEDAHAIQLRLGDELNRGWTIGGLVRAHLGEGSVPGACQWLEEFTRFLHDDVEPLYEYAFLLRTGSVAIAAGVFELAAQILGALDALEPPASLSPTDLADRRAIDERVAAALASDGLAAGRARGRGTRAVDLAQRVLEACSPADC